MGHGMFSECVFLFLIFIPWKLVVKIKLNDSLPVFPVVVRMKPLVGKGLMGSLELEMMCRDVAEGQANLEEAAPRKPFVRVCVCVLSTLRWLRTVTHFKSTEWSSQTGMLLSTNFPLPTSHSEVSPHPPLTPFKPDRGEMLTRAE